MSYKKPHNEDINISINDMEPSNGSNSIDIESDVSSPELDVDDNTNVDVPDIDEIELSKKETFYYKIIDKYYKTLDIKKIVIMIDIIDGKSKISLRLLDWFITKYADKHKIRFEQNDDNEHDKFDEKIDRGFNVHISYKAQLKSYKKKYFDPFRRRKKFRYYFGKDSVLSLCTTIGQLNFFRWTFINGIIDYIVDNYSTLSKAMVNTNKAEKTKKLKEKSVKDSQKSDNKEKLSIKNNGIIISAKKKVIKDEVKIILSFD